MGAAAVFETAAETPPTVIRVSCQWTLVVRMASNNPSPAIESDGDNDREVCGRVAILKKSITNGGLE
jgi:hypothetical protein